MGDRRESAALQAGLDDDHHPDQCRDETISTREIKSADASPWWSLGEQPTTRIKDLIGQSDIASGSRLVDG
jgi:hypothetical protein